MMKISARKAECEMDIEHIVGEYSRENDLQIQISTDMPEGYENANGTFDIAKNTLFWNADILADAPEYESLFFLFHELRHALQYTHPEQFSPLLQRSLSYVLMYDGTCYKMVQGDWKECRIQGSEAYLSEAYLGQPYEVDANRYAYEKTKELCGDLQELDRLYGFWMPQNPLSDEEYMEIYQTIDSQISSAEK